MPPPDRDSPCVRLFISVDLVGSTAFKTRSVKDRQNNRPGPPWVDVFKEFYIGFPLMFERRLGELELPEQLRPRLVKTIGDEVLLQTQISGSNDARRLVRFLAVAIVEYKKKNLPNQPLLLKATAWIAGFPINNHRVPFEGNGAAEDFIGPSIDAGFRIARSSSPSKLVVSVDLALLLLAGADPLDLYFEGTETLKGVLDGRPYPIIWYKVASEDDDLHIAELKLRRHEVDRDGLKRYCDAYVDRCIATIRDTWLIRPYFRDDPDFKEQPKWHQTVMRTWTRIDARNDDPGKDRTRRRKRGAAKVRSTSR